MATDLAAAATSEVMRRAATALRRLADAKQDAPARDDADELRARADLVQQANEHAGSCDCPRCDVLRRILERR